MARKVLLSGDPEGKLGALFKRVAAVNKSNGPFDMLICVGSFFPPGGAVSFAECRIVITIASLTPNPHPPPASLARLQATCTAVQSEHARLRATDATLTDEEAEVEAELSAYLTGAQTVPVPTYFIGSFGAGSRRAMAALAASSSADVTYLGRRQAALRSLAALGHAVPVIAPQDAADTNARHRACPQLVHAWTASPAP